MIHDKPVGKLLDSELSENLIFHATRFGQAKVRNGAWDHMAEAGRRLRSMSDGRREALDVARRFGGIDGDHHKAWVIDQMCRKLLGDEYDEFVAAARTGEDGPETYDWDEGTPP